MIHIYLDVKSSYQDMLKQSLKQLQQPPISLQFHEFHTPFHSEFEHNIIFCEITDDTRVSELKKIKSIQGEVDIILLTNNPQLLIPYAILHPFGWIITSDWEESMKLILTALQEQLTLYECSIHYHSRFLDFTLHPNRILYIESYHHDIYIYTDTIQLKVRGVLRDYHIENSYVQLIQVHKSYIVNLTKIKEIKGNELILNNDASIPIGDVYKPKINEMLDQYMRKAHK